MNNFKQFFTEVSKKDVMGGLQNIIDIYNPDNYVAYGHFEFDYDGMIADYVKYETPKKLPSNSVYVTKSFFIEPGQKPDYRRILPIIYITDKHFIDSFDEKWGVDDFIFNDPYIHETIDEWYKKLGIDGENKPKLP